MIRVRGSRPRSPQVYNCSRYGVRSPVASSSSLAAACSTASPIPPQLPGRAHLCRNGCSSLLSSRIRKESASLLLSTVKISTSTVTEGCSYFWGSYRPRNSCSVSPCAFFPFISSLQINLNLSFSPIASIILNLRINAIPFLPNYNGCGLLPMGKKGIIYDGS